MIIANCDSFDITNGKPGKMKNEKKNLFNILTHHSLCKSLNMAKKEVIVNIKFA